MRSCRPDELVAEAAPAGETTPGAGTLADEHTKGADDVTGAAGSAHNRIPLRKGPRQAEEQPSKVL